MVRFYTAISVSLLLLAGIGQQADANDIWSGGSPYAHFGLGLPHDFNATYADGMGLSGVAMHDNRIPSVANPAAWSRAYFSNISGAFEINSYDARFGEGQNSTTRFQTGPFQMVLPVSRERIGVSLSFTPLTSSRYATNNEYVLSESQNNTGEEMRYGLENRGDGGINRIELGVGIRLTNALSVGYAPSLLLGSVNRNQNVFFDDLDYRPVYLTETTHHYGFGNRFGLYYSSQGLFRSRDRATFGATVSLPVNLTSERSLESRINSRDVTIRPTSYYGDGQATFPLEAGAGFSYNFNPYLLVGADVLFQNWSEYTNFEGHSEVFLKDRMKVGLGTQYLAARRGGATIFSRFIYRMGVSYDTGSLQLDGNDIETLTLHAGFGIPSSGTNSSIDINAEYGFRGTEASGLISERIFAVTVSFNLSEIMFFQRRLQ